MKKKVSELMTEVHVEEVINQLENIGNNQDDILVTLLPIITALLGAVMGAWLTYYISEKNNKNQFKRDILKYLNENISEYLFLIEDYSFYVKENKENGLYDKEKENVKDIGRKIQVYQNKIDVIIKNNNFSKNLEEIHQKMTNNVRHFNASLNPRMVDNETKRKESLNDLSTDINKYLNILSSLINENLS